MSVRSAAGVAFPVTVPVVIVGAGAAGLTAALAAREAGADVLIVERDAMPYGSTALSSGLIPAAGTRWQAAKGVADDPSRFAADIMAKNKHRADPAIVAAVAANAGPTLEWLGAPHGVPFDLVEGFLYSGHSALRMHGTPSRSGRELIDHLHRAATASGAEIMTSARAHALYADDIGRIAGIDIVRPDGSSEAIGCGALVLACNGYGGNRERVARHIPEMADALYFGHPGNQGDALAWGEALGAASADLGAYQGHGSVAHPHGILVTWALMMEGGFQVNAAGQRFSNEHAGYSEQAVAVLRQPGKIAYSIYDERLHRLALDFADYGAAVKAGAVRRARRRSASLLPRSIWRRARSPRRWRRPARSRPGAAAIRSAAGSATSRRSLRRSTACASPARCSTPRVDWRSTSMHGCCGATGRRSRICSPPAAPRVACPARPSTGICRVTAC